MSSHSSFTLIELLVVIAILAILATAIVVVINPVDLIKQSRDSTRLTDLNAINKALGLFDVTNPDDFTGTSTYVYTSLPAQTAGECPGMPSSTLPSGYMYYCVTSSTLSKTDGTGWIPVSFQNISYGSPIGKLPVDPINSSTTGQFYTYVMGGSWELNALLESNKYRYDDDVVKTNLPGVLSIGSNKNLNPAYNNNGLLAYYQFNEQTGTTLNDSSGNAYTGTITAGVGGWATNQNGISQRAYDFDGANTVIDTASNWFGVGDRTISIWIYADSLTAHHRIFTNTSPGHILLVSPNYNLVNTVIFFSDGVTAAYSGSNTFFAGAWYHVVVTRTSSGTANFYLNGVHSGNYDQNSGTPVAGTGNNKFGINTGSNFNGRLSDFRVYNRVLSAAEIKGIYNATR